MSKLQSPAQKWLLTWGWLGLGLTLLTALVGWLGWTRTLDMAIYDRAQSIWHAPAPDDIVIVAIDDASLSALGRWPWKRAMHASLLDKINEGRPAAILLHVLFTEPDPDPLQDQALAQALQRSQGKVVLPMGFSQSPADETLILKPIALLAAQAHLGHADAVLDADGVMRHAYMHAGLGAMQWPHLAQALIDIDQPRANHLNIDDQPASSSATSTAEGTWARHQPIALRFLGEAGSIRSVSYMDVLSGAVPASTFEHKTVLIGATAHGLGDTFRTPTSSNGAPMASVEIVAQMVAMLRQHTMLHWVPAWAVGLVSAALLMGLIALYWTRAPRRGLLLTLLFMALVPLASLALLPFGVWFAPCSFMLMAALSYPIWSWRRLEVASNYLADQLQRLGHVLPAANNITNWNGHLERQAHAIESIHLKMEHAYRMVDRLIQQLPCAVVLTDKDGRIIRTNSALLHMLHMPVGQTVLGLPAPEVLSTWQPVDAPDWTLLLEKIAQAQHPAIHTTVRNAQGDIYLASIVSMGQTRPETQTSEGAIICLTDVTASKQTEKQRDELLGFIAHDIRSPQASLLALVELHQLNASAMPVPELLKHVDNLARNTIALSEELIHVMHSESSPLQLVHVNLAQLLETTCLLAEPQAMSKGVSLIRQWTPEVQAWVWADENQLQRALMNLLSNAIRFSPDNGQVKVTLALSQHPQESGWEIGVHDQGEGISPDNLSKLFRRYSRLNSTDDKQMNKGFGLGLVFVETVFKRHGGQVHVSSQRGQGSVFMCTLPEGQAPTSLNQPK